VAGAGVASVPTAGDSGGLAAVGAWPPPAVAGGGSGAARGQRLGVSPRPPRRATGRRPGPPGVSSAGHAPDTGGLSLWAPADGAGWDGGERPRQPGQRAELWAQTQSTRPQRLSAGAGGLRGRAGYPCGGGRGVLAGSQQRAPRRAPAGAGAGAGDARPVGSRLPLGRLAAGGAGAGRGHPGSPARPRPAAVVAPAGRWLGAGLSAAGPRRGGGRRGGRRGRGRGTGAARAACVLSADGSNRLPRADSLGRRPCSTRPRPRRTAWPRPTTNAGRSS
jgi:hypothetical protein